MSVLRLLAVVLAFAATASLAVGSVGFTQVTAERGVQVSVVADDEAYVGVTACTNGQGNGDVVHLRVSNRFIDSFDVTSVTSDDATVHQGWSQEPKGDTTVAPGERLKLSQKFDDAVRTVDVVVTGDGFEATVTADIQQSLGPHCPGGEDMEEGGPNPQSTTDDVGGENETDGGATSTDVDGDGSDSDDEGSKADGDN